MTQWTWQEVVLSYLFLKREGMTVAQLRKALPEGHGLERVVDQLVRRGLVSWSGKTARITAEGRNHVPQEVLRRKLEVKDLTQKLLPALAVGLEGPLTQEEIEGALLARAAGKAPMPAKAAKQVLLWKQLGVDTTQPFTLGNVQKFLLARSLQVEAVRTPAAGFKAVVAREAGVAGSLRAGLRGKFLRGLPEASVPAPTTASFAQRAIRAAASTKRRFGRDLVYVSDAFTTLSDRSLSLEAFKAQLLEAHRNGEVRLRRADLAAAMDPELLRASEIVGPTGATLHFIQILEETR